MSIEAWPLKGIKVALNDLGAVIQSQGLPQIRITSKDNIHEVDVALPK